MPDKLLENELMWNQENLIWAKKMRQVLTQSNATNAAVQLIEKFLYVSEKNIAQIKHKLEIESKDVI